MVRLKRVDYIGSASNTSTEGRGIEQGYKFLVFLIDIFRSILQQISA